MESISLLEYNNRIKGLLYDPTVQSCWVTAETSDLRVSRGHCYLELLQKNDAGVTIARLGAVIWASTFAQLNYHFQQVTGKPLASNMKVMVKLSANFHEQYGLKAIINDINAEFTLGDMERIRREISATAHCRDFGSGRCRIWRFPQSVAQQRPWPEVLHLPL